MKHPVWVTYPSRVFCDLKLSQNQTKKGKSMKDEEVKDEELKAIERVILGRPCNISDNPWKIVGTYNEGSGIIAWCYDKEHAIEAKIHLQNIASRFGYDCVIEVEGPDTIIGPFTITEVERFIGGFKVNYDSFGSIGYIVSKMDSSGDHGIPILVAEDTRNYNFFYVVDNKTGTRFRVNINK